MKRIIKKITPDFIVNIYHWLLAQLAAYYYAYPSTKMTVIGVTGTNGKSTTVNLLAECIEEAGFKVGFATTINFKVGVREWLNEEKMTMLGRFKLQKLLYQMAENDCRYAIIETSSEGIKQYRHMGIDYDVLVFTNLTPEHIDAHGSFENYKKSKLKLFKHLEKANKKYKKIIGNLDDKHVDEFLDFRVTDKIGFTLKDNTSSKVNKTFKAENIKSGERGSSFDIAERHFHINLIGKFQVYNALAAAVTAKAMGIDLKISSAAFKKIKNIPGRVEFINEKQPFKILVDYAPEPEALKKLYQGLDDLKYNKLIHVLGSCGGGRDVARRPLLGQMAATKADVVIVTNEDPYDDDPDKIINDVADGATKVAQVTGKNIHKITDRREAIHKALSIAKDDDLVLVTGKGAEQAICVAGGKKIAWDDRAIIREELKKI